MRQSQAPTILRWAQIIGAHQTFGTVNTRDGPEGGLRVGATVQKCMGKRATINAKTFQLVLKTLDPETHYS